MRTKVLYLSFCVRVFFVSFCHRGARKKSPPKVKRGFVVLWEVSSFVCVISDKNDKNEIKKQVMEREREREVDACTQQNEYVVF